MMTPGMIKRLSKEVHDLHLHDLRRYIVEKVDQSRRVMSQNYERWDWRNMVYRGEKLVDKQDAEAKKHGEPAKMVVPLTFAQVQTFVSFLFLLFRQNDKFYQYQGTGGEDEQQREVVERLIDRDLRKNAFNVSLLQFLTDVGRFGLGAFKVCWRHDQKTVALPTEPTTQEVAGGVFTTAGEPLQLLTLFEGNDIKCISPYRVFPDTSYPLSQHQKGEFCAIEDEYGKAALMAMQKAGDVAGVEFVRPMSDGRLSDRGPTRADAFKKQVDNQKTDVILNTEVVIDLDPRRWKLEENADSLRYIVWLANDDRIIRIEPYTYAHQQFPVVLGEFAPDVHNQLTLSLSDIGAAIQDVVNWLFNSRIASVRQMIENRLIVDPEFVDMDTLLSRSPIILMSQGAARAGVDTYIRQLQVTDNTQAHVQDAQVLMRILEMVTGINETAQGQFHGGRRSATEARGVQSGSASRLQTTGMSLWAEAMDPAGQQLLANQRQFLSIDTFMSVLGQQLGTPANYQYFHQPVATIAKMDDFFVHDSSLPSDKGLLANALQELAVAVMSNPEMAMMLDIDPKALIQEVMSLRGVENMGRFSLQQRMAQEGTLLQSLFANGINQQDPSAGQTGSQTARPAGA